MTQRTKKRARAAPADDTLDAFLAEEKVRDPDFAAGFEAEVERLAIGRMLKLARERNGLTQVQLAARAHTHQSGIARLEKGGALPQLDVMSRLAGALGLKLKLRLEPVARAHQRSSPNADQIAG